MNHTHALLWETTTTWGRPLAVGLTDLAAQDLEPPSPEGDDGERLSDVVSRCVGEVDQLHRRAAELEQAVEMHVSRWNQLLEQLGQAQCYVRHLEELETTPSGGLEKARKLAFRSLDEAADEAADDGWPEGVDSLEYGFLVPLQKATQVDVEEIEGFGPNCNYELQPTPIGLHLGLVQPAPVLRRFNPEIDRLCEHCDATLSAGEPDDGWEETGAGETRCPSCAVQATLGELPVTAGEG